MANTQQLQMILKIEKCQFLILFEIYRAEGNYLFRHLKQTNYYTVYLSCSLFKSLTVKIALPQFTKALGHVIFPDQQSKTKRYSTYNM